MTGPVKNDKGDGSTVNLRKDDEVRDLDELLADAEYKASIGGQDKPVTPPKLDK